MRLAVHLFFFLVPHFRTIHYFRVVDAEGNKRRIFIEDPKEVDEESRQYIHCVSIFVLFGKPCFPRYYAYQPS